MPLRLRLAVLFALATAAVIAVGGLAFILQLRVSVDASLDPGLRPRVAIVADELGPDGMTGALAPSVGIVQVSDANGALVAWTPEAGTRPMLDPAQRRQAQAGEISFTADVQGDRSRVLATTIPAGDRTLVVAVGTGTDVSDAAIDRAVTTLAVAGPPAALLGGLGAWWLAGAVLRPVERMRRQAAAISDDNLARRLAVPATHDEIAALGTTMNDLLSRVQDAVERERGFVADAGHELRTPLAILRAELELAARPGRSREALGEAIAQAREETDRLIRLAEDLLLLARADDGQPFLRPTAVHLPDLLRAAARGADAQGRARGVAVEVDTPNALDVTADADRLRQAVDNLLDNAIRHAPDASTVEVRAALPHPDTAVVTVADRGPGFPESFLPHAFERFQRAEASRSRDGGGTGLGLSIVRAIVRAHGGHENAANRDDGGAIVRIELPVTPDAPMGSP